MYLPALVVGVGQEGGITRALLLRTQTHLKRDLVDKQSWKDIRIVGYIGNDTENTRLSEKLPTGGPWLRHCAYAYAHAPGAQNHPCTYLVNSRHKV